MHALWHTCAAALVVLAGYSPAVGGEEPPASVTTKSSATSPPPGEGGAQQGRKSEYECTGKPTLLPLPSFSDRGGWISMRFRPLAFTYDTNLAQLADDVTQPSGPGDTRDFGFDPSLELGLGKDGRCGDALRSQVGLWGKTWHAWHPDQSAYDLNAYAGMAFAHLELRRFATLGIEYEYTNQNLNRSAFLDQHRVAPLLWIVWQRAPREPWQYCEDPGDMLHRTDLRCDFEWRDYHEDLADPRLERDGNYYTIVLQHTWRMLRARQLPWGESYEQQARRTDRNFGRNRWLEVRAGYEWAQDQARGTEFDGQGHTVAAGVSVPLVGRLIFDVDARFTWVDYANPSLYDGWGRTRADFFQAYHFGLTWIAVDDFHTEIVMRGGVLLENNDSNLLDRAGVSAFEYHRVVYGLQLEVNFRNSEDDRKGLSYGARSSLKRGPVARVRPVVPRPGGGSGLPRPGAGGGGGGGSPRPGPSG